MIIIPQQLQKSRETLHNTLFGHILWKERVIFMTTTICPLWDTAALNFAVRELEMLGVKVSKVPGASVTHALLPVPSPPMKAEELPPNVTIIGGRLEAFPDTCRKMDLLQDAGYLAENAALTADCALRLLGQQLGVAFYGCPILVIGWGRIGKCLAQLLRNLGARVTVAARKESDRGMLTALGYDAISVSEIQLPSYRAVLNTAPAPILDCGDYDGIAIDLASVQGLTGPNVQWARGLPGKMLPEASGQLIARSVVRILQKKEGCR